VTDQYVDSSVSRAKFGREIREFRSMEGTYRKRGWFLLKARFPNVLVLLTAPHVTPPPVVMGVTLDYTNYDAAPPSVRLVDPFSLTPYRQRDLPLERQLLRTVAHGPDDIPFLCIAGTREYHEHPAHSGDAWELHRQAGAGRLVRILDVIHTYGVAPINGYAVTLTPQITGFSLGEVPS
jgi:hypothetical protein